MATADRRAWADQVGFALVSAVVVVVGFLQGRASVVVPLGLLAGVADAGSLVLLNATVACLVFSTTLLLSAAVFFADVVRGDGGRAHPTTGPSVAAIVPIYGDAAVLDRSVGSLLASRYEDLDVYVVCEPGDEPTVERARELATAHERVHCLVNTDHPGSKAAAVNFAAQVADEDYLGVFDADERVHPEFVAAAVAGLDDADLVQGRTLPRPDGLLENVVYYESVVLGYLTHRLLSALTGFRMATSNVLVMRREAFRRVGGYDPSMLTEDFNFAFRCYEEGVRVEERLEYPSEIEAAHTPTDWWGQRKRWMTGYAQVLHRRLEAVDPVGAPRTVVSLLICAGAILGNLFLLSLASQAAALAAAGAVGVLALPVATVWVVCLGVRLIDARAGHVEGVGLGWLLVPVVAPLYSLAAIKGFVEYPLSWSGEWYRVTKQG
ncbi:glycosyltransferase [Halobium salinum]|uniref:Glycosyltransferase n=1 Tax=Halobium salinum TaxID=1364940 RepID=A0ABD5P9N5_9EURY|nr:glycosyltransferase family 2 protein [Halobium salinum]